MLTVSKLNKEIFTKDIKCVSLGKLSSEVAEFILKQKTRLDGYHFSKAGNNFLG